MTKIEFKNLPDTSTPLNASNLNTLQDNVENAIDAVAASIITPDDAVSTISTNAVENQAITNYVDGKISDVNDDINDIQSDITTINGKITDSGWVDMSSYINTTYFTARPGQTPMVRKIGKICYWKGAVYCTTAVGGNKANLFTNLPSTYSPPYEQAGCGVHFPSDDTYIIFFDGSGNIVINEGSNWIQPTLEYEGYALGNLGSYPID